MSIALIESTSPATSARSPNEQSKTRPPKRPSSQKRLISNRANSQKSTGPRTPAGKAKVSKNATKHALCSQSPLLPNECPATYQTFEHELQKDLRPSTA